MIMKKIFVLTAFVTLLFFAFACNTSTPKAENVEEVNNPAVIETAHDYYTCTMHPEVHSHEAGLCPVCGMDLIKVAAVSADSVNVN